MNRDRKSGFTTVELVTVLAIIAILTGLLLPALSGVRNAAREAKQKAQLATIEFALTTFRNDFGDYPPSDRFSHHTIVNPPDDYCGSQKLTEALLGRDLMGFHPNSSWSGTDPRFYTPSPPGPNDYNLSQRKGPYLELATAKVFRVGELFANRSTRLQNLFVLCDAFGVKKIFLFNGEVVKAGTPILYYKANTSSKLVGGAGVPDFDNNIYNILDNHLLVGLGKITDERQRHRLEDDRVFYSTEGGVIDPKVTARPWPYRPDSYILISAGVDGLYGTGDDITNFRD